VPVEAETCCNRSGPQSTAPRKQTNGHSLTDTYCPAQRDCSPPDLWPMAEDAEEVSTDTVSFLIVTGSLVQASKAIRDAITEAGFQVGGCFNVGRPRKTDRDAPPVCSTRAPVPWSATTTPSHAHDDAFPRRRGMARASGAGHAEYVSLAWRKEEEERAHSAQQ
jgi:hypothetical protein